MTGRSSAALRRLGRAEAAIERVRPALEALDLAAVDPEVAALSFTLGSALVQTGASAEAAPHLDRALVVAQALELPDVLAQALSSKGLIYLFTARYEEARALFEASIAVADRHGLGPERLVAESNSGDLLGKRDDPAAAARSEAALATARRLGDRSFESLTAGNLMHVQLLTGRWDDVERLSRELLDADARRPDAESVLQRRAVLCALRGDLADADACMAGLLGWEDSDDVEARSLAIATQATVALAKGEAERALERALAAVVPAIRVGDVSGEAVRQGWPEGIDAAVLLGELDSARELLALLEGHPRGTLAPYVRAQVARARGLIAAAEGEAGAAETALAAAIDALAALGYPYWLARARTDLAEWLAGSGRIDDATALAHQALETFDALRAAPAAERARRLLAHPAGRLTG